MARDTLKTLIRLSRFEVDERRRELQALLDQEEGLRRKLRDLEEQERAERQFVSDHREHAGEYGGYAAANKARREAVLTEIAAMMPDIEAARNALAEAFAEQKRYEIAAENQRTVDLSEENRQEREELDELSLQAHRRKEN